MHRLPYLTCTDATVLVNPVEQQTRTEEEEEEKKKKKKAMQKHRNNTEEEKAQAELLQMHKTKEKRTLCSYTRETARLSLYLNTPLFSLNNSKTAFISFVNCSNPAAEQSSTQQQSLLVVHDIHVCDSVTVCSTLISQQRSTERVKECV